MNNLEVICKAWQTKNPKLLERILADSFVWHEDSSNTPITSKKSLLKMWENDLSTQTDIKIELEMLCEDKYSQIAHWKANFQRQGEIVKMDGIFYIKLDDNDKLIEFRQWWAKI